MFREKARIEEHRQRTLAEAERNKADVETGLKVLQLEREAVAASREAEVYEAAADLDEERRSDLGDEERAQRTREYVQNHTPVQNAQQLLPESQHAPIKPNPPLHQSPQTPHHHVSYPQHAPIESNPPLHQSPQTPHHHVSYPQHAGMGFEHQQNSATERQPAAVPPPRVSSEGYTNMSPQIPDFATYLIRREMVSSGLT
ncbi:hypothetical protein N1851_031010 [Merluccius polli]|nr:hypothetical protein N1851_031010 [Merluccius polli]